MSHRVGMIPRDARAHFRIQVSRRPALACLASAAPTPSLIDGVFCVKGGVS